MAFAFLTSSGNKGSGYEPQCAKAQQPFHCFLLASCWLTRMKMMVALHSQYCQLIILTGIAFFFLNISRQCKWIWQIAKWRTNMTGIKSRSENKVWNAFGNIKDLSFLCLLSPYPIYRKIFWAISAHTLSAQAS